MTDVIAGHLPMGFFSIPPTQPHIKSGNSARVGDHHEKSFQTVPGPAHRRRNDSGYETGAWYGLFAPAGTPPAIVEKISAEVRRIVASQDFVEYMLKNGFEGVGSTPAEFAEFIAKDTAKVESVIRRANVRID